MKKILSRLHASFRGQRGGFTLVEMIVVVAITVLMSTAAISYSTVGQNQISLTIETAKVAALILQARELTLNNYSNGSGACGYGVHFDLAGVPRTYSLFAYTPKTFRCPSLAAVQSTTVFLASTTASYAPSSWKIPVARGVNLLAPSDLNIPATCHDFIGDVFFYPPAPATLIDTVTSSGKFLLPAPAVSTVCLRTADGKNTAAITVNPVGQVSF